MDHRRFLAHPEAHRPFAGGDLFARIGGRAAIDTLVDGLAEGSWHWSILSLALTSRTNRPNASSGSAGRRRWRRGRPHQLRAGLECALLPTSREEARGSLLAWPR